MKRLTLIIGLILLVLNWTIGLISSSYSMFNTAVNSVVIVMATILIYALFIISLRDAYRISLSLLFLVLGVVEFMFGCLIPRQVQDNWYLLAEIIIICFEIMMIIITYFMSNKTKN